MRYAFLLACLLPILITAASASEGIFNVRAFGATGNGKTADTRALQKAIDACAAKGGGTVLVPAGTYLTAPVFLASRVTLQLDAGATLVGSRKWSDYPAVRGRWEGVETEHKAALVTAKDVTNVAITGQGTIDGQGDAWWGDYKGLHKRWAGYAAKGIASPPPGEEEEFDEASAASLARPRLVQFINCRNVAVRGVTLKDSPSWTLHTVYCEHVAIDGLTVLAPGNSPNTDGINPDSCRFVQISNCFISCGDDCIAIKSGKNEDGRRVGRPCEDIVITNCIMREGHAGVAIGSETSGGVRDVAVSNCVFVGTQRGIRLKSQRGRGGVVENLSYSNIVMRDIRGEAIVLTLFYHGGPVNTREPVTEATPCFRSISISDVRASGAKYGFVCHGLVEMPIKDVSLSHVRIASRRGIDCANVKGLDLNDVRVESSEGPAMNLANVEGLRTSEPQASPAGG